MAVYDIIFILGMFTTRSMPSWPVSAIKIIYPVMYPIVHISYTGSIFMIVLVSFERYVSVCHMREVPIKRIILYTAIVTLFAIICNIPSMMIYKWETIDGAILTKRTNLGKTFTENWDSKRHLLEPSWPILRLWPKLYLFLGIKPFFSR